MRSIFRHGVLALALLAFVGLAVAGELGVFSKELTDFADETTGSIGPAGARRTARALELSLEEQSRIFGHVMRIPDAPVADIEPPEPAAALPNSVALQDLPAGAARDIPQVKGYKFVKLDDWVLIVSPASRMVVAQMPRYKLMQ